MLGDDIRVNPLGQHEAGVGMSQVMEADTVEAVPAGEPLESMGNAARIHGGAVCPTENHVGIAEGSPQQDQGGSCFF